MNAWHESGPPALIAKHEAKIQDALTTCVQAWEGMVRVSEGQPYSSETIEAEARLRRRTRRTGIPAQPEAATADHPLRPHHEPCRRRDVYLHGAIL